MSHDLHAFVYLLGHINLGVLYGAQSKRIEAEKLLQRTVRGQEKLLGPLHYDTVTVVKLLEVIRHEKASEQESQV